MSNPTPPLLPGTKSAAWERRAKLLVAGAVGAGVFVIVLVALRACGLIYPFLVPSGSMTPALAPGAQVLVEGFTYLARSPRRGDVAVFKTGGITPLPTGTFFAQRIAGQPGDRLRITDGKLHINDQPVALSNVAGTIVYPLPAFFESQAWYSNVTVPAGHYYVLGDNATNSYDSRFWGFVPATNFVGRIAFCYWPLRHVGGVR